MDEQKKASESSQGKSKKDAAENAGSEGRPEGVSDEKERAARAAMEGQAGDSLSWIEGPDLGSPIEELPTLQWPDVDAQAAVGEATEQEKELAEGLGQESGPAPDELEEAIEWLEKLAEEQGTSLDEMPTLISRGESRNDYGESEAVTEDLLQLGDTTPSAEIDSDPMAWLEQLAIDQSSPLEELPSVADRLLASEIVSQVSTDEETTDNVLNAQPTELEAALRYLEELADAQGISLDEVSFDEKIVMASGEAELDTLDQLAKSTATVAAVRAAAKSITADADDQDDLLEQIPEDPDEALAWLAELAEDEPSEESDVASAQEPGQAVAADGVAVQVDEPVEDADVVVAIPSEPVEDVHAIIEEPRESAEEGVEMAEEEGSALKKATTMAAAAKMAKSRMDQDAETEAEQEKADEVLDTDILEGMPDDPDEAMLWMAGLAAAEEAKEAEQAEMVASELAEEVPVAMAEKPAQEGGEPYVEARHALAAGNVAAVVKDYRERLDSSGGDPQLIEELESMVAEKPDEPDLLNVLGDAYMQTGQIQKALEAYRKGLS